ncbi:MAG: phytanoyl-CoA dioxygenase family protein [Tahibacter sp.]
MKTQAIQIDPIVDLRKISAFRAENFPYSEQIPWLDRDDWRSQISHRLASGEIGEDEATLCRHWAENGYVVIPSAFSKRQLKEAWSDYEQGIANSSLIPQEDHAISVQSRLPGRVLNPHFKVAAFEKILRDQQMVDIVSLLLGVTALPFQTIAGHKGSEQLPHSDSIHMTTYPQGFLIANWIAFEDIAPDSGPLQYYPGSHRMPYAYSRECGIGLDEARASYAAYHQKYETFVQKQIANGDLQPHFFYAKTGDVLFWHANLLHGGSRIQNATSSRHALVCHYFAEGCICYHDYTGSPSHLTKIPFLEREDFNEATYLKLNPDVAAAGADAYGHYVDYGFKEGRPVR